MNISLGAGGTSQTERQSVVVGWFYWTEIGNGAMGHFPFKNG